MRLRSRARALLAVAAALVTVAAACGGRGDADDAVDADAGDHLDGEPTASSGGSDAAPDAPALPRWPAAIGDPCRGRPLPPGQHYVPAGFCAREVASGVGYLRQLAFAPNGDLFGTDYEGSVFLLRDDDGDGSYAPAEVHAFATTGGVGSNDTHLDVGAGYLYSGSPTGVRRFRYDAAAVDGGAGEDVVVGEPSDGSHRLHTVHVYDGWLYVHSGSADNASHESGPSATDYDTARSLIKRFDLSKLVPGSPFAWDAGEPYTLGLRNAVGFTRNATTKRMYAVVNGVDNVFHGGADVHDDNPGEQLVELLSGAAYGFPFCWTAQRVESFAPGTQVSNELWFPVHDDAWCAAHSRKPMTFFQAHSAPLDVAFFDEQPTGALPEAYRGGAFVALHGSFDRATPTGYKVVWVPFDAAGDATMPVPGADGGVVFPFVTVFGGGSSEGPDAGPVDGPWHLDQGGFAEPQVKPAGVAISPIDGALYVASDVVGTLYRVGLAR